MSDEIIVANLKEIGKDIESFDKRIEELKANFDDHTHLVWFNKIKELEEEDDHIKHVINVNRTGVSNLFTNYGVIKEVLRELIDSVIFQGIYPIIKEKLLAKLSGSGGEKEDDVINIREMVKTLTNKEWVLVKREDLQWLNDNLDLSFIMEFKEEYILDRIKEVYGIK